MTMGNPSERVGRGRPSRAGCRRRGMLLVVVLGIIAVMALLGLAFTFLMRADLESAVAIRDAQQAREAAMSGVQRVIFLLRDERVDMDSWWNNPKAFRRALVWAPDTLGGSDALIDQEEVENRPAWRFSIVQHQQIGETSDDVEIRYGIIDEAGKLNLNTATREQLLRLFDQFELENIRPEELADTLIDWRDENDTAISDFGAESPYYIKQNPPYRAKNRYLETVEEILLVKGFDRYGSILYGEDYNRNGYLDENEDDGVEGVFPPDDGDGVLDRGLLPFVTVVSWDFNSGNDNKQRIDINKVKFPTDASELDLDLEGGAGGLPEHIIEEIRPEVIEFIGEAQKRGFTFRSVGELYELEVFEDGSSNYDKAWEKYGKKRKKAAESRKSEFDEEEDDEDSFEDDDEEDDAEFDEDELDAMDDLDREDEEALDDEADGSVSKRDDRRRQSVRGGGGGRGSEEGADRPRSRRDGARGGDGEGRRGRGDRGGRGRIEEELEAAGNDGEEGGERRRGGRRRRPEADGVRGRPGDRGGRGGRRGGATRPADPADAAAAAEKKKGTPIISPVDAEDMVFLMDRLSVVSTPAIPGLINVNTASALVLNTIPGLSEADVDMIVGTRQQLSGEDKETTAWLVSRGVVEPETFGLISNHLTTRSIQFTIDSIGFADHTGTFVRLQVVVEMRGHLSQIRYYRDISQLGLGYPVHSDEGNENFAYSGE